MKIMVTGGAGFIGSHIVDKLVDLNHEVVIVDNLCTGNIENINPKSTFYKLDITNPELEEIFKKEQPQYVIHHAAQIDIQQSLKNPIFDAQVNILGTLNILENCKKYNVQKIIYASSAAGYGNPEYLGVDEKHPINPLSFYGISKHTPEHYITTYASISDLKYTILRYANVYGIRQDPKGEGGVISIFVDRYLQKEQPIIFGNGEQTRDFIYVSDIADANIQALEKGDNEIINISCNTQTSVNELVSLMNQLFNQNVKPIHKEERKGDILHSYLDNTKALNTLNWHPKFSLTEGLNKTIEYYKNAHNENQ